LVKHGGNLAAEVDKPDAGDQRNTQGGGVFGSETHGGLGRRQTAMWPDKASTVTLGKKKGAGWRIPSAGTEKLKTSVPESS